MVETDIGYYFGHLQYSSKKTITYMKCLTNRLFLEIALFWKVAFEIDHAVGNVMALHT